MTERERVVLENLEIPGIKLLGIVGSKQYIVTTALSEYSFTDEEEARQFAYELASKREVYKTATFVRPAKAIKPPAVERKNRGLNWDR